MVALAAVSCAAEQERPLTILAAASLTDAVSEIAEAYEEATPGARVRVSFGPSTGIVTQAAEGAPVDVLVVAGADSLDPLEASGMIKGRARRLATNTLALIVPAANPAGIKSLVDITAPGIILAVCDEAVPCGAATSELFQASAIDPRPASFERDVRAVLGRVALGEADAGIVYATDARAGQPEVVVVISTEASDVRVAYEIATVSDHPDAGGFAEFALGEVGQRELGRAGFGVAESSP